jgi:polyhydroxyalkanoate synthase
LTIGSGTGPADGLTALYAQWAAALGQPSGAFDANAVAPEVAKLLQAYTALVGGGMSLPPLAGIPSGRWRATLAPWLQAAESAYQQWARSPAAADYVVTTAQAAMTHRKSLPTEWGQGYGAAAAARDAFGLPAEGMPRVVMWEEGAARVYQYGESTHRSAPLFIVYAMINRPSILDLDAERSMIRGLVAGGRTVYVLEWGDPGPADQGRPLVDWVLGTVDRAVRAVAGRRAIDLMGICQGGVFALCYAALEPRRVRRLVTLVTPVDCHTPDDVLSHWIRHLDVGPMVSAQSAVSGAALATAFQALAPYRLGVGKYLDLLDHADDPRWVQRFRRMERWVHDSPDQPAAAWCDFVQRCYQQNQLVRGTLTLGDRAVDLGRIEAPLLNVYALDDHIVPPAASRALAGLTRSKRYDEIAVPTGHIGIFVSQRAAGLPARIAEWLARR